MSDLMLGKKILVFGARNKWSIAWHCATALRREGASVAFSVYGEREQKDVASMLEKAEWDAPIVLCNATSDEEVEAAVKEAVGAFGGELHGVIHAIAFAKRDELKGEFVPTSKEGFTLAHESSVYTLISIARSARPYLAASGGGSIVTLTYLGAERVIPNYNVMGVAKAALEASMRYLAADLGPENIRVNAVSAGPIKTLSASGIAGFDTMLKEAAERAPLRRTVEADDVADGVLFLLSDLARGVTGETLYVDGGYHIMG